MKKIISLVVVATMLFTLFAVNVSAAVPTKVDVANVTAETFDYTELNEYTTPAVCHPSVDITATNTLVQDATFGTVLNTKAESGTSLLDYISVAKSTFSKNTVLPDQYTVKFNLKAVANSGGITVNIEDSSNTNNSNVTVALAGAGFEVGDWYEYRLNIDRTKPAITSTNTAVVAVYRRNITDGGKWQLCDPIGSTKSAMSNPATGSAIFTVANGGYRAMCHTGAGTLDSNDCLVSFGFCKALVDGGKSYDDEGVHSEYQIDNIGVYSTKNYVSEGILASQDFEDPTNTRLTTDHGGNAKAYTLGTDAKNGAYGKFTGWTAFALGDEFGLSNNDWALTFDIYLTADMAFDIYSMTDGGNASNAHANLAAGKIPAGKWYTCKLNHYVAGDGRLEYMLALKERGTTGAWAKSSHYSTSNIPTSATSFDFVGKDAAVEYYLDNVVLAETEAISFPGITKEDNTLSVGVAYDEPYMVRLAAITSMVPVLATFDGGVLVDVDFETVAHEAGYIEAELSADATDADEAWLYIWRSFDYASPIMDEAYDLSSYLQ